MFNCFFYSSAGEAVCRTFLKQSENSKTAIVIDPPFGGLAEILAQGIRKLWGMAEEGMIIDNSPGNNSMHVCNIYFSRNFYFSCFSVLHGITRHFCSSISLDDGLSGKH